MSVESIFDLFGDEWQERWSAILKSVDAGELSEDAILLLRNRYGIEDVPPCRVCGEELHVASMGGGRLTEFACQNTGFYEGNWDQDHYSNSKWTAPNHSDSMVLLLLEKYEELRNG